MERNMRGRSRSIESTVARFTPRRFLDILKRIIRAIALKPSVITNWWLKALSFAVCSSARSAGGSSVHVGLKGRSVVVSRLLLGGFRVRVSNVGSARLAWRW